MCTNVPHLGGDDDGRVVEVSCLDEAKTVLTGGRLGPSHDSTYACWPLDILCISEASTQRTGTAIGQVSVDILKAGRTC